MLPLGRGNERTNSLVQRQRRRKYIVEEKRRGKAEMSTALAQISMFMWYGIWPAELSRHAGRPDMQHMHSSAGDSSAQHLVLPSAAPGLPTYDAPCSSRLVITRCSSWLWHAPYIPDTVLHWGIWAALGCGDSMTWPCLTFLDFAGSDADLQHCHSGLWPCGVIWPRAQAD